MVKGKTISQQVINCAFEVSNRLGAGFLESVYENALCVELEQQGIGFQQQVPISVEYKDQVVGNYVADLIVANKLFVELKALSEFSRTHDAQVMNYL